MIYNKNYKFKFEKMWKKKINPFINIFGIGFICGFFVRLSFMVLKMDQRILEETTSKQLKLV